VPPVLQPALPADEAGGTHNPLTDELVDWADFIFVMERQHQGKLQQKHKAALKDKRLIVLGIPDDYAFMDPALVRLLRAKMLRWLPKN
jgi:predicted protein tyrosine phosphatase